MARETSWYLILVTWLILGMTAVLLGQTTQPATPTTTPTTTSAPAEGAEGVALLVYEVYEVQGQVRVGPTDADPELDEGWRPVQKEDQILAGQKIFVPNKARLKLVARPADPPTVIMLEPNTLINVSELTITNGAAVSRIDLGYGAIRAGVAEGTVRSDMQIQAPGVTLSKRGTDIFRLEYFNGRFVMSLSERGRGMIQAIQMQSTAFGAMQLRSRFVTPGQYVTQQMVRAIDTMQFERQININDLFGLIGTDQLAVLQNQFRFGFFSQQGMSNSTGTAATAGQQPANPAQQAAQALTQALQGGLTSTLLAPPRRTQRAGDFGIGQGGLPSILDQSTAARQQKAVKWWKVRPGGAGLHR